MFLDDYPHIKLKINISRNLIDTNFQFKNINSERLKKGF